MHRLSPSRARIAIAAGAAMAVIALAAAGGAPAALDHHTAAGHDHAGTRPNRQGPAPA